MTIKELVDSHLKKSASHHNVMAKNCLTMAKAQADVAVAHERTNPMLARAHRDCADCHSNFAKSHQARQQDFEDLREALAEASDADVSENHSDAGDDLKTAAGFGDLLKNMRLVAD
ncbi:MAG: hypothetical protein WBE13_13705 [Candidatus Acidiferrum sp.]